MPTPFIAQFAAPDAADLVVVSVLAVRGSAPRHVGAYMAVRADGRFSGTVGGGQGERAALEAAAAAFASKRSSLLDVRMLGDRAEGEDMICGGVSSMLVEYASGPDLETYRKAAALLAAGRRIVLARALSEAPDGTLRVALSAFGEDGTPIEGSTPPAAPGAAFPRGPAARSFYDESSRTYFQVEDPEEKLLILGAGHVGTTLAGFASRLGFSVTVVDERPEFADQSRFPAGTAIRCGGFVENIEAFPFDGATSAVVVTPGHLKDIDCVRAVFAREFRYLGMIGSSRKTAMVLERLRADGFPSALIDRLHAPIGLDIGAETPQEISVSVLAEMISVRRGGNARRARG